MRRVATIYQLLGLFFLYSFIGWVFEVIVAAVWRKKFVNRGVLSGPLCCIYGFAALAVTIGFQDLRDRWAFLFLGAAILCSFVEWVTGHLLEKLYHRRWWDYSGERGCIDHYTCLRAAATWGIAGVVGLKFINPLLLELLRWMPAAVLSVLIWVALGLLAMDAVGSYITILKLPERWRPVEEIQSRLLARTVRFSQLDYGAGSAPGGKGLPCHLRRGGGAGKAANLWGGLWLLQAGAAIYDWSFFRGPCGDGFCRLTAGVWMSRSSVVWGPFSIVWGLAIAIATKCCTIIGSDQTVPLCAGHCPGRGL